MRKKRVISMLLTLLTVFSMAGCTTQAALIASSAPTQPTAAPTEPAETDCRHAWAAATCQMAEHCEICGAYRFGEDVLAEHQFTGGSCTEPQICAVCGAEGARTEHSFSEATCTEEGVCSVCGAVTPALGHDMTPATCTEPATCQRCGETEGEALGHDGNATCGWCGYVTPTEAAAPVTPASASDNSSIMVWIPQTGSKYHTKSTCSGMKDPTQVTEEEAIAMGYTPCKRCH